MSKCQIQQTKHLRTNSTRKSYISESSDDFDETKTPTTMDNDNSIMKKSQSLDDLLDIDDNDKQNAEDTDETENDDSTQLSMDEPNTTVTKRQKKSNKKKGKL